MKDKLTEGDGSAKQEGGLYPYFPLYTALKVSDAVKELGGARSEISKSALAKHLGEPEKSPTFQQRIASAKVFGLIEGRGEYLLSETAKNFYFPTTESDKSAALLDIFSKPLAFKALLQRFDGDTLPSREILGNILHRELRIPDSWKDRVAAFFAQSAQFVGAIDDRGFIRHKAGYHKTAPQTTIQEISEDKIRFPVELDSEPSQNINRWDFSFKGQTVKLETPIQLEIALWEKLNAYVQLIKPIGLDITQ
jgi:hypothetical protein